MSQAATTDRPRFVLADAAGTRRFTVAEYHRMLDAGVLYEGEPVELLEGYVVKKWEREPAADAVFPKWCGLRRFSVDEFQKLIRAGILREGERVELLDGYVVLQMSHNPPHDGTIQLVAGALGDALPVGWCVRVQSVVRLSGSEPEPVVAVARGDRRSYVARHPTGADIGLIVEVADSSVDSDRADKGRLYARDAVPVYWIVNIADRQVEVFSTPQPTATPPGYATTVVYRVGQGVPLILDGVAVGSVAVIDLLP